MNASSNPKPRKLAVIFGTRPEAIKLAPVILALREHPTFECHVCVTAQHRHMLDQVLDVFQIVPDTDLDLMEPNQTLGRFSARSLEAVDRFLTGAKPDLEWPVPRLSSRQAPGDERSIRARSRRRKPIRSAALQLRTTILANYTSSTSNISVHRSGAYIFARLRTQCRRTSTNCGTRSRNLFTRVAGEEKKRDRWPGRGRVRPRRLRTSRRGLPQLPTRGEGMATNLRGQLPRSAQPDFCAFGSVAAKRSGCAIRENQHSGTRGSSD